MKVILLTHDERPNHADYQDEDTVTRLHEMPEMDERSFKASIYGHLKQINKTCKVSNGIRMRRQAVAGFRMKAMPYFIASFYPKDGEWRLTCPPDAEDDWLLKFDRMFNCSHCMNEKEKILAQYPDFFEGENSRDFSSTSDEGDSR